MGQRKDQNRVAVEADTQSDGDGVNLRLGLIAWLTLANPCVSEIGVDSAQALNEACFITRRGVTPNDPKLSDRGGLAR